jgi:hypothetical protein
VVVIARAALSARGNPEANIVFVVAVIFGFIRGKQKFKYPSCFASPLFNQKGNNDKGKKVKGNEGFCASVPLRSTPRRMTNSKFPFY